MIPFMKEYKKHYGVYPKWSVGDAGYGSYDNLMFNVINRTSVKIQLLYKEKHQI